MNIENIETIKDVRTFALTLCRDEDLCFHPDDSFSEYVDEKGNSCYTDEECEVRDKLMAQCFDVCQRNGVDIYDLMGGIVHSFIYPERRIDRIETLDDVKRFIYLLCEEEDTFFNAVDIKADLDTNDGDKFFTDEEIAKRALLKFQCLTVCDRNNVNISNLIDEVLYSYYHPEWDAHEP